MDIELEPEKISGLRERLDTIPLDEFDERDVNRIKLDDKYAQCFIQWRKGDMDLALKLAQDVLKWRKEKGVYDLTPDEIPTEIVEKGIIYAHGKAKDGTILVHFISRRQTKDMKANVQRLLTLWLERVQQAYPGHHMTFLLDVSKSSLMNVDLGGIRFMLDCFTTNFPGMLERIIILEMPWIMNAIWKVVKQWMTEDQRRKTVFASFKELKQHVDPDQLLEYYGGNDTWEYSYPPFPDTIPDMKQPSIPGDEPVFVECEVTENLEESIPIEEIPNDLEVTVTSEPPIPQDSSSFIMDESALLKPDESELSLNQKDTENTENPPNGDVRFLQTDKPANEQKSKEAPPEILVSKSSKELNKVKQTVEDVKEIKLGKLLSMSPISEVSFSDEKKDKNSGRYQSSIILRNTTSEDTLVTFKVKTTSPERYHVKPSTGKINTGEKITIRISLSPGNEDKVMKDRFLILYQTIGSDEDVAGFWKKHTSKDSRNEYRVRVKFEGSSSNPSSLPTNPQKVSSLVVPPPTHSHSSLGSKNEKLPTKDDQLTRISRELISLRRQVQASEEKSEWWRTKFQVSLILQALLLLLLLFLLHKLSAVSAAIEIGLLQNKESHCDFTSHTASSPP